MRDDVFPQQVRTRRSYFSGVALTIGKAMPCDELMRPLKEYSSSQLDLPVGEARRTAGDFAEVGRVEGASRRAEVGEIEDVGDLGAELELDPFEDTEVTEERRINVANARSIERVGANGSRGAGRPCAGAGGG